MRARRSHTRPTTQNTVRHAPRAAVGKLLESALAQHRAGHLDAARESYIRILSMDAENFDALHLLGVVAVQIGQPEVAVQMIELALRVRPGSPEALNSLASALAASGETTAAEAALRLALKSAPAYPDALQNLGSLLLRLARNTEALEVLARAQRISPENPGILNNLGSAYLKLGRPVEAEQVLRAALVRAPHHTQALLNLGRLLIDRNALDEASQTLERAGRIAPHFAPVHHLLGETHERRGDAESAAHSYTRTVRLDPKDAAAWSRLGLLLLDDGDIARALEHLRRAADLARDDPGILANLARGALLADCIDEGISAGRAAIALDPQHIAAHTNLAALERCRGRFDDAERLCRHALAVTPGSRSARLNLSTALAEMGRYVEAEAVLAAMLAADYGDADAHWNLALSQLARGSLDSGWEAFEWRWRLPVSPRPSPPAAPEWRGTALKGRTLLVWPEQGIGDQILFASMIPDLLARQINLILECDARLVPLFQRSFDSARIVATSDDASAHQERRCDLQLPIGSLPRYLRTSLGDFPKAATYLSADRAQAASWQSWLDSLGAGTKIGVCWRSHNLRGERRLAFTALDRWRPLLSRPGCHFICLQYDDCTDELQEFESRRGMRLHRPPALDQRNDLDAVAALLSRLDLVISAPTTVSVLAGAMGTPTWQLSSGIDWHGLAQPHSPWQPNVRRFHKAWNRTWDAELDHVATELDHLLAR